MLWDFLIGLYSWVLSIELRNDRNGCYLKPKPLDMFWQRSQEIDGSSTEQSKF